MSALTSSPAGHRTWRFPRLPMEDWVFITFCGWGAMLLGVVVVGNLIDHWAWIAGLFGKDVNDIAVTGSIWGPMSGVAVWFVGFVVGYYLHYYLPAFVANGRTRRDSAIEAGIFGGALAATATVLITIGFVYERVVYAIAGWQRGTPGDVLYHSFNDYGRIFLAGLVAMLMWAAGGAMIGSAFYRGNVRGMVTVVIAIGAVDRAGGIGGVTGPFGFVSDGSGVASNLAQSVIVSLVATVVLAAITWWNVKSLPLRNK